MKGFNSERGGRRREEEPTAAARADGDIPREKVRERESTAHIHTQLANVESIAVAGVACPAR